MQTALRLVFRSVDNLRLKYFCNSGAEISHDKAHRGRSPLQCSFALPRHVCVFTPVTCVMQVMIGVQCVPG